MRCTIRRAIIYILTPITFVIFILNVKYKEYWIMWEAEPRLQMVNEADDINYFRASKALYITNFTFKSIIINQESLLNDVKLEENVTIMEKSLIHWFFRNPTLNKEYGFIKQRLKLWPEEDPGDRIVNQLLSTYKTNVVNIDQQKELKHILLYTGMGSWDIKPGRTTFLEQKCPVNTCSITEDRKTANTVNAILFRQSVDNSIYVRPLNQIWILYLLECPYHTPLLNSFRMVFNLTATYRHDSDIVTPYEKFVLFDEKVKIKSQEKNYAANKTKKVVWFVSNCFTPNKRLNYALELQKYISLDIYGACGSLSCPRSESDRCSEMLDNDYKFYLSFENSNCRDYITEKFFVNGLSHNVIPIVMGAAPEDYNRVAPYHSYIHVDDFDSPKELADYLHKLDQNDTLYNEYFQWKGTGEFINTYFWCRVCAMLHDPQPPRYYDDINAWWRGPGICTHGKWPRKNSNKG